MSDSFLAGAATVDVTPEESQFLYGYPHVPRWSTGVHDPLLCSALYLSDGATPLIFAANDVIYIGRATTERVRRRIEQRTGVPAANVMISATHTHSGPLTVDLLVSQSDPVVPKPDPRFLERWENGIVEAAVGAYINRQPAAAGFAVADGSCVGNNRHDPAGPSNPETPVVVIRRREGTEAIAAMLVCAMHPTVLHEDSKLFSGDFPAATRTFLQQNVLGAGCPVLYHTGPCGDQSPRHVTKSNTFEEAQRLGNLLGRAVAAAIDAMDFTSEIHLDSAQAFVDLPPRAFPTIDQAASHLDAARKRLDRLRQSGAERSEVRTAECDWFGAEETLELARTAADGRLQTAVRSILPAEIQLMLIGPYSFVGWPGECFCEFALAVRAKRPDCHVISLANGELQGYLVSRQAVESHWYEGMNSLFDCPNAPLLLVEKTLELLESRNRRPEGPVKK
jgi:neutral ceramidase